MAHYELKQEEGVLLFEGDLKAAGQDFCAAIYFPDTDETIIRNLSSLHETVAVDGDDYAVKMIGKFLLKSADLGRKRAAVQWNADDETFKRIGYAFLGQPPVIEERLQFPPVNQGPICPICGQPKDGDKSSCASCRPHFYPQEMR